MDAHPDPSAPAKPSPDPLAVIRSRGYLRILLLAGLIGVPVSIAAYGFLALVDWLQEYLFTELPGVLGFADVPLWWPFPLLALSGLLVGLCIQRLPGTSGHPPSEGFKAGGFPQPRELPGVVLAALATLALGAVLGPEAPLIALGGGLGALAIRLIKKDSPPSAVAVVASAGSFAAVSTLLGSPLLGAFLLMEASGLAGAMLGVGLLPGLLASGIGSLVFVGLDSWTGLGTFSLALPDLPSFSTPTAAMFLWALGIGVACPLLAWGIRALARIVRPYVHAHRLLVTPVLGLAIAGLAVLFAQVTGEDTGEVLFSGQSALPSLINDGASWPLGAVGLLILCKALAYGLSLSAFRGGPVFPAMFVGAALGIAASHLPGMALVPAVGVGIGAMCVSMLRLPLTSVLLATVLLSSDAYAVMPLVIVAVVVAHVITGRLPEPPGRRLSGALPSASPSTV
ncbi:MULTISPECIES: chloride channel protein [unclassified Cryobacterium]|uniref:chloride channel protein n=1 Tax=unclassified Cryobacterium TaxID=2649013 RepID=UPI00106993C2|nr:MULTISPECIES: chloride channel protein [unclassified Cryobacterium]TFC53998.1 chloride channel protein [Cryobacterium sp. TMB3-1-2]TFC73714.1 chloride channel protein [Cryobacterium sp. TMB3-15]TFC77754.1 chloride channel protein [Cryobacterium sp. TMB3-10]TFD43059.1 chloride channel protein [Cryobacterium sp. TMB3-12]